MSEQLVVRNLAKVYENGVYALQGIDLDVKPGEFVAVIGLSGSGKSTFLRCVNKLIQPSSGSIKFEGEEVLSLTGSDMRAYRRKIGMVFQHFNLVKRRTVLDNVLYGALGRVGVFSSLVGIYSQQDRDKALECLSIVGMADKAHYRADELSGGQQQRVAIARALMQDPKMILADEPVASLDPATSHSVMKYIKDVNQKFGTTVLANLHFLSLVREYADSAVALKKGKIVFRGKAQEIDEKKFREIYGEEAKEVEIH